MRKRLPLGTKVEFDISEGHSTGTAFIIDGNIEVEDGEKKGYYKLAVINGKTDIHRNEKGELWVNDYEVKPISSVGVSWI